jgi:hypothetical protein
MSRHRRASPFLGIVALGLAAGILGATVFPPVATGETPVPPSSADKKPVFEQNVLPILKARCVKCHGGEKPKAKLRLGDMGGLLTGGESGPVVVPGSAEKSLLFKMVSKGEMPPAKEKIKLTSEQVAVIKNWIDNGAPAAAQVAGTNPLGQLVTDKYRQFWAFQKLTRPAVPKVQHQDRVRTPIDAFILAKLESKGLTLAPDADWITLIRRASLDLLGLPPAPEEVDAFLADKQPDAYERLIDRLLASPHYGERWGRHWLDAAGYADTIGGDNDPGQAFLREGMWRYRDYVVRSLNDDKPYDRFLMEQLAGDEMDDWRSAATLTPHLQELLIATGFLHTSVDHTYEDELNRPFERYQVLHDTIENLTSNLLGLTVACARCHDHKFDPIPQVEYYRLLACLKPVYNPEAWIQPQNRHCADVSAKDREAIERHNAAIDEKVASLKKEMTDLCRPVEKGLFESKLAALPEPLREDVRAALATEQGKRSEVQKYLAEKLGPLVKVEAGEVRTALKEADRTKLDELERQVASCNGQRRSYGKIQAICEPGSKPPPTYVFRRGNYLTPGAEVQPGFLSVLTDPQSPAIIPSPPIREGEARTPTYPAEPKSSGRRTAWARWLTRPDHPLTARVFVNRVWQHHFGEGIVATPDNFGHLGSRPTHPELLDWLATEFVRNGWKMKELHRLIVTSTVYRQASVRESTTETSRVNPNEVDPGNQLLWKMRLRRLESEVIRDSVLAVSGKLDGTLGGPPTPIEPKADGLVVVAAQGLPSPTAGFRRSIYLVARRNYNLTLLSVFDQPVMATNCTRRISSAVPLQSLTLLNDAFMLEQADHFAERVAKGAGDSLTGRIELAFRLAFARPPTAKELAESKRLVEKIIQVYSHENRPPEEAGLKGLAKLCQMLMCANEFLYAG